MNGLRSTCFCLLHLSPRTSLPSESRNLYHLLGSSLRLYPTSPHNPRLCPAHPQRKHLDFPLSSRREVVTSEGRSWNFPISVFVRVVPEQELLTGRKKNGGTLSHGCDQPADLLGLVVLPVSHSDLSSLVVFMVIFVGPWVSMASVVKTRIY